MKANLQATQAVAARSESTMCARLRLIMFTLTLVIGGGALTLLLPEQSRSRTAVNTSRAETSNVLNALPKSLHAKAKADLHEIWMAPTHAQAVAAFDQFLKTYRAKYPKAADKRAGPGNSDRGISDSLAESQAA